MGVSKVVTVVCDYPKCGVVKTGPAMLSWNETDVEQGRINAPDEAKYLVLFNLLGTLKSFCCQLHAAEFFLPPGYEAVQKQVIELPNPKRSHKKKEVLWMDAPMRSEGDSVAQGDGDGSPDNGQEGA